MTLYLFCIGKACDNYGTPRETSEVSARIQQNSGLFSRSSNYNYPADQPEAWVNLSYANLSKRGICKKKCSVDSSCNMHVQTGVKHRPIWNWKLQRTLCWVRSCTILFVCALVKCYGRIPSLLA